MRGEEGDLEQVVPAERVVRVLDVVLAERHGHAPRQRPFHRQRHRAGVRIADEAQPHLPGQVEQRVLAVGVVVPDGPRVAGHAPALEPVPAHRLGEHAGGVVAGIRGVVGEHRDPPSQPGGQRARPLDVRLLVGRRGLDPRDAADDVGPGRQRLLDQLGGARVPQDAVLREGDHRDVDPPPELLPGGEHRLDADQPGRGVDVGERLHVQDAVAQPVGQRLPDVRQEGLDPVVLLDRAGEVDAAGGVGHPVGRVRLQRGVADQRQRAHLVQVQVGVDERLGHQPATGLDDVGVGRHGQRPGRHQRRDPAAGAVDVHHPSVAQPRLGDDQWGRGGGVHAQGLADR